MNPLTWSWIHLSGKKRWIALIYWSIIMPSLLVWYPDGIPPQLHKIITIVGIVLSALGMGHAAYKHQSGKK